MGHRGKLNCPPSRFQKDCRSLWINLPASEKAKYELVALKDRLRFRLEMASYKRYLANEARGQFFSKNGDDDTTIALVHGRPHIHTIETLIDMVDQVETAPLIVVPDDTKMS